MEEAATRPRPVGESPGAGFGVEIQNSTQADRRNAASHFSSDGKYVEHGDHCHPNAGDYTDPDFKHEGLRAHFYGIGGLLVEVFLPHSSEIYGLKNNYPDAGITWGDIFSASLIDLASTADAVGGIEILKDLADPVGRRPAPLPDYPGMPGKWTTADGRLNYY